ncbi:MAG: SagB/ThcOx family dehydrogenase [Candidatus Odinarchaeota archaeon]
MSPKSITDQEKRVLDIVKSNRKFLKAADYDEIEEFFPDVPPDQQKGIQTPPFQKDCPENAELIDLVPIENMSLGKVPLIDAIRNRKSHRKFTEGSLTLEELSFLLWATQGVRKIDRDQSSEIKAIRRTVPSGGSRHPFETYLIVSRVERLRPGIYRYLSLDHKLYMMSPAGDDLPQVMKDICFGQSFAGTSAVLFIWAAIPYRTEWRYSFTGHKDIAIEAGHICQNLYLACEAVSSGTCAIAAYDQKEIDKLIGADGIDEFTVYIAPVGKV